MILFSRPAAEVILRQYAMLKMSTTSIMNFYNRLFRVNLDLNVRDNAGRLVKNGAWLTLDWGYTPTLYLHGYTSVGSIPNLARDLEFPPGHFLLEDYVPAQLHNAGLVLRRSSAPLVPPAPCRTHSTIMGTLPGEAALHRAPKAG
jgi:hypothetical protein